jgi:hypothetical protein
MVVLYVALFHVSLGFRWIFERKIPHVVTVGRMDLTYRDILLGLCLLSTHWLRRSTSWC